MAAQLTPQISKLCEKHWTIVWMQQSSTDTPAGVKNPLI